jgi:hypothetical protein
MRPLGFRSALVTLSALTATGCLVAGAVARSAGDVKIAAGRLAGSAWTLRASVSPGSGGPGFLKACFTLSTTGRSPSSAGCGQLSLQPGWSADRFFGMSERGVNACPGLGLAYGAVAASARAVKLTLSNGTTIRATTIPARSGLPRSLRFYVSPVPCAATVRKAVATSASGKVVGRLDFSGLP